MDNYIIEIHHDFLYLYIGKLQGSIGIPLSDKCEYGMYFYKTGSHPIGYQVRAWL